MPPIPRGGKKLNDGIEKPKHIREVPKYLFKKFTGFFSRLFYIIGIVWETSPLILVLMTLLCVLDGVLPVAGAYISAELLNEISRLITDSAVGGAPADVWGALGPLLILFAVNMAYLFLKRIITKINSTVTGISGELVVNHIKMKIINKSREVDIGSFDRPEFYEKLENANREAGMRPIHILTATFNVISALISSVSFIVILSGISPYAPLLIIVAAIPGAAVNFFYRNQNFFYIRFHSKERREMNYYSGVMVNKDLAKEIRILGLSDTFVAKYTKVFRKYFKGLRRLMLKEGVVQVVVGLVATLVNSALFVFIAYNVIWGGREIGDYSLYSGALTSVATYMSTILASTATIYEGTLFIDNMIEFMKEKVTVKPTVAEPKKPMRGVPHTIEFKGVSFMYPGTDKYVLKDIDLVINPAESLCLVGLNGAGKTTLIKLLTRLYDPTEGVILLDGVDIKEYDTAALYDMFGIIFQDFGHYAVTAAENIEFGDVRRSHRREDVIVAAERGSASEFISKLPEEYDTPLTRMFEEEGIELSGGQWQKLSVARAFYKDSDILILDEPTASLDALAEKAVFDRFAELSKNRITVFVSHRLSSCVDATKIVVIDGGSIKEVGTHYDLMAKGGIYFKLFSTQAQRYTGVDAL